MKNQDIIQAGKLADASLELFNRWEKISSNPFEREQAILNWEQVCETTVKSMGASPELSFLKTTFKLSNQALAFICMVLLPQLNSRYIDLYTALSSDKEHAPNPDIVSSLVTTRYAYKSNLLKELNAASPVFYWNYLFTTASVLHSNSPLKGSQTLVDFLSGKTPDKLNDLITRCSVSPLHLSADNNLIALNNPFQIISGGFEERQLTVAINFAVNYFQRPLYRINVPVLSAQSLPENALKEVLAFVTLNNGMVYWQNALHDFEQNAGFIPVINNWLSNEKSIFFTGETDTIELPPAIDPYKTGSIQLRPLSRMEEKEVWKGMGLALLGETSVNWELVNNTYTLNMKRMGETMIRLRQGQYAGKNTNTELFQDCYIAGSPKQLEGLAYLENSNASLNDMVLDDATKQQLYTLQDTFLNRSLLDKQIYPGVISVFRGYPGNGKTMAAESTANTLKLPIYRVDYTQLENASESSLEALFAEAEKNSAALIFDEADALFAVKKNAAVLITAFLIQRIESYGGLAILTTNADQKIDPAFFRRALNVINFPLLGATQRLMLFKKLFAAKGVQLDKQLNLANLTNGIIMSCRSINNIVNAAIINAAAKNPTANPVCITQNNFINALKQETK